MNSTTKDLLATIARTETERLLGGSGVVHLVKLSMMLQKGGDYYRAAKVLNDALHFMYPSTKAQEASTGTDVEQDNVAFFLPEKEPIPVPLSVVANDQT